MANDIGIVKGVRVKACDEDSVICGLFCNVVQKSMLQMCAEYFPMILSFSFLSIFLSIFSTSMRLQRILFHLSVQSE